MPRTWQTSIGFQRQLGETMAVEADYVYTKGDFEKDVVDNINLLFDPATGANLDFRVRANRPYPNWGVISMNTHVRPIRLSRADHRLHEAVQQPLAGVGHLYTVGPLGGGGTGVQRAVRRTVSDGPRPGRRMGIVAGRSAAQGRLSGIWQVGRGFQVSGLHYLGAGIREAGSYGGDLRNTGATFSGRLRPDGTIVPLNSVVAPAQNRTDLRVQQRIDLPGRAAIDAIAEVFNIFDRPNYDIGTQENQRTQFLQPINAQDRSAQVGFRLTF